MSSQVGRLTSLGHLQALYYEVRTYCDVVLEDGTWPSPGRHGAASPGPSSHEHLEVLRTGQVMAEFLGHLTCSGGPSTPAGANNLSM